VAAGAQERAHPRGERGEQREQLEQPQQHGEHQREPQRRADKLHGVARQG